ncbi:unnamed protein product [Urochloa decumbens]|uniref:Uncharacterized protein n=1 Tax=Urochloa decumbens TaxID=240449 RepID=A0ABC8VP66_9POAL
MAYASPGTDTSTDLDADEKNQLLELGQLVSLTASGSGDKSKDKLGQKALRRLAQNREAARKSRLRKKAYVEQLENSKLKLAQLEQELQRARQQGIFIPTPGDQPHSTNENGNFTIFCVKCLGHTVQYLEFICHLYFFGALACNMDYARWQEDHNKQTNELRALLNAHASDNDLRRTIDSIMAHYGEAFRLKRVAAKADAFHVLSAMWKTPVERCFLWLGEFRPSELLKLLASHLEPLTEQQFASICNLQQSSQQAEEDLSQGLKVLQQSVAETLTSGSLCPAGSSGNAADCSGQMAVAIGKLGTLENFLQEADNLRLQTLQQMQRILTTRQSARALLAISDYFSRLRALSSLWIARPRE